MWLNYVKVLGFLIVFVKIANFHQMFERSHRSKRYLLVYPRGGSFKIIFGFGVPIKITPRQQMVMGWNLQFQYQTATNITQLETYPPILASRRRAKRLTHPPSLNDRTLAYMAIEDMLNSQGFDGHNCLLRTICENALYSLHHSLNGLYGLLLHIILTPNYGNPKSNTFLNTPYFEAQQAGHFGVDCSALYPACHSNTSLLDIISTLE